MNEANPEAKVFNRRQFLGGAALAAGAAGGLAAMPARGPVFAAPKRNFVKTLKLGMVTREDAEGNRLTIEQRLQIAKDAGFASVEPDTLFDEARVAALGEAAAKVGIDVDGIICSTHWGQPLSDPDPAVWERTMEGMRVSMRNAKALGGDMVLLVPAVVNPEVMYRDAYARSVERVKRLAEDAERLDITIGIENVWNKFLLSPIEAKQYIEDIGSERVRFWFDVGNVVLFGYPQDWIRTLGPLIARIDVKDFDSKTKQFVPLREGSVDWPEVMRAFDEIGYEGYMAAEVRGGDLDYLTRMVSEQMDAIIASG